MFKKEMFLSPVSLTVQPAKGMQRPILRDTMKFNRSI